MNCKPQDQEQGAPGGRPTCAGAKTALRYESIAGPSQPIAGDKSSWLLDSSSSLLGNCESFCSVLDRMSPTTPISIAIGAGPSRSQKGGWSAVAAATVVISKRVRTKLEPLMSLCWRPDRFVRLERLLAASLSIPVLTRPFTQ